MFVIMVYTTLNMDHRKLRTELSQEIRKKIIDKHVKGKGYKTISKQFDIHVTTVAHIIQKFKVQGTVANIPEGGCKRKIGQGTSVSDRTIIRCLSQSRRRRTPLFKANHIKAKLEFAKMHIDNPQGFWENVLWKDETKLELVSFKLFQWVFLSLTEGYQQFCPRLYIYIFICV